MIFLRLLFMEAQLIRISLFRRSLSLSLVPWSCKILLDWSGSHHIVTAIFLWSRSKLNAEIENNRAVRFSANRYGIWWHAGAKFIRPAFSKVITNMFSSYHYFHYRSHAHANVMMCQKRRRILNWRYIDCHYKSEFLFVQVSGHSKVAEGGIYSISIMPTSLIPDT